MTKEKRRNKTAVLHLRVTPEVKTAIEKEAAKQGRTVTNYIEWLALRSQGKTKIVD